MEVEFQTLESAFEYLKTLNAKECIDDHKAYEALFYLGQAIPIINYDIYLENSYEEMLANILLELYKINSELKFDNYKNDQDNTTTELSKNDLRINVFGLLLNLLNISFIKSVKFAKEFSNKNGLDAHLLFLKDEAFTKRAKNLYILDSSGLQLNLIEQIVLNVYILSKTCEENLQKWIDLDAVNVLLNIVKQQPASELDAYLAICNIANDKQIDSLTEIHKLIKIIKERIHQCSQDFQNNIYNRLNGQITENDQVLSVDVHCIQEQNGIFSSILVYLSGLYRLTVNDKLRYEIYFTENFKNDLKILLLKGNEIEMTYTLKLYAQLSFNSAISIDLANDQDLINFLKFLETNTDRELDIDDLCKQIFWNISQNIQEKQQENQIPPDKNLLDYNGQHIMISYNSASRDLCLQIKSILESNGHTVWIDVGNIYGSSLDSMAKAVEDSFCVLVCVTEKYRQSVNCQAEAQYAFKLNKPIIPLIMQKGYENVKGWLGIIISDKIFVNFTKYDFDECIKRLKHEIDSISSKSKKQVSELSSPIYSSNTNPILGSTLKLVESWDENKVKEWFNLNKIDEKILKNFSPCNGSVLKQLFEMRRDAPEFYYQSLNKNNNVELTTIILFTECLNKLFNSN